MRYFLLVTVVLQLVACAIMNPVVQGECGKLAKLSEEKLVQIVIKEFRRRGSTFSPTAENSRIEFSELNCDQLVKIVFLPEQPGGFEIFRIGRNGKIVEYIPGY